MSKYTTEVRFICETYAGYDESQGYMRIPEIISKSRKKVFDFDFPIFDEDYRGVLETKILKHYYLKEIGMETVGVWKHFLDMKMNEIMPYYNKLYESALIEFDPLRDVDITKSHEGSANGETEENRSVTDRASGTIADAHTGTIGDSGSTNVVENNTTTEDRDNTHWDYYSDTPQGSVGRLDNLTYLTNARKTTDVDDDSRLYSGTSSTADTNTRTFNDTNTRTLGNQNVSTTAGLTSIDTTDEYLDHIYGKQSGVSFSKLLMEYRETFLNIDMMIIDELKDLFMNLW